VSLLVFTSIKRTSQHCVCLYLMHIHTTSRPSTAKRLISNVTYLTTFKLTQRFITVLTNAYVDKCKLNVCCPLFWDRSHNADWSVIVENVNNASVFLTWCRG